MEVDLLFIQASSFNDSNINTEVQGTWEGMSFRFLNGKCYRPKTFTGKLLDTGKSVVNTTAYLLRHHRKYDVFYFYSPNILYFWNSLFTLRALNRPIVAEWTEIHSKFGTRQTFKDRMIRATFRFDERYGCRLADHLIVISKRLYRHYRQCLPEERLTLLPIVVDPSRFPEPASATHYHQLVGYLGSFGPKDNVVGIIRAFRKAQQQFPNLRLRLMGYFPSKGPVRKMLEQEELDDSVEITGQLAVDEIPGLLSECSLLIVNRTNTEYSHHGFPTKLGEYLATGNPVISTRVGDVEDYLTHGKDVWLIEPEDTAALAAAIHKRFEESGRFNEIGEEGRKTALRLFSYREHMDTLLKAFRSAMKRHAPVR